MGKIQKAATEKATDIGNAAAAAMAGDGPTGNTVAEDGTTEGDDTPATGRPR